jgi:hypothetical protein
MIVLDEPDDPRTEEPDYAILEQVEGRWLGDELHEDAGTTALRRSAQRRRRTAVFGTRRDIDVGRP